MKATFLFFASIIILLSACNTAPKEKQASVTTATYQKLDSTAWLLGNWFNTLKEGNATENWKKLNDSTFTAESLVIAGNDTLFFESVNLEQRNEDIHYVVSVKGQNQEAPVSFKLTSLDDSKLVFENPGHDFPSKITYTKVSNDSLYAEISGVVKGQEKKEGFPFKKLKP